MTESAPAPLPLEWGIVYGEPKKPDVLLDQRYTQLDVALRVIQQIAKLFIANQPDDERPYLTIHRTSQNVTTVTSQKNGKVWMVMRPVVAERWVQTGHRVAPPEVNAYIQRLLDDDDWL